MTNLGPETPRLARPPVLPLKMILQKLKIDTPTNDWVESTNYKDDLPTTRRALRGGFFTTIFFGRERGRVGVVTPPCGPADGAASAGTYPSCEGSLQLAGTVSGGGGGVLPLGGGGGGGGTASMRGPATIFD